MLGLDNPIHILFLLVIVLLVFGAKRLPEMGQSLGSGLRGFKDSLSGDGASAGHLHLEESTPATAVVQPGVAAAPAVVQPAVVALEHAAEPSTFRPAA
jgi:sec-independent protein translocase protein TatA